MIAMYRPGSVKLLQLMSSVIIRLEPSTNMLDEVVVAYAQHADVRC